MARTDSNHEFVHKVLAHELERYMNYVTDYVTAKCGKTWAPSRTDMDLTKPYCPACFTKVLKYAWAA